MSDQHCEHITGYWINKPLGMFRCLDCGCQCCIHDLPKTRRRRIEVWA